MNSPTRADFRYFCPVQTRWGDLDSIGHVNNAKYFTYDEQARISYLQARLADPQGADTRPQFILARIACDFIEQLHHPSPVEWAIRIRRIGRSSMETEGACFVGERCHARTQGVIVWFDYAMQKVQPLPDAVRAAIRAYEIVKPEE